MAKKWLVVMAMWLLGVAYGNAQEVVWSVDFDSHFANREGGDELRPDQTFLFTRLAPEIGIQLGNQRNGHTLKGGVSWLQPLNSNAADAKVSPTLYYQYRHKGWRVNVGMIPRTEMEEHAPRYLWSDSLAYRQPNIRGVLAQYQKRPGRGYAQLFLDWRQQQADFRREAFNVLISGKAYVGNVWFGGHVQYNHLAKSKLAPEGEGVNDDVTVNPMAGFDWRIAPKASLKVKAGAIINLSATVRKRTDGKRLAALLAMCKVAGNGLRQSRMCMPVAIFSHFGTSMAANSIWATPTIAPSSTAAPTCVPISCRRASSISTRRSPSMPQIR